MEIGEIVKPIAANGQSMDPFGDIRQNPELQGIMGLAMIVGAGLSMGLLAINHAIRTQFASGEAVYVFTPMLVSIAIIVTGVLLWHQRFDGPAMLRIGGWMFIGMIVIGLLVTWTITHEAIRGDSITYGLFVTINNVSIGGFIGLILGWLDASNKASERELEREHEMLEAQIDQLDEFASIVSHDLRNPLNVATLRLQSIKAKHESDSVEELESALSRMERIIDDVLTMAREGRGVEETERIRLEEIAAHSWNNVDTDDATLDVTGNVVLEANRSQLEHIFENLYRNAIAHGMRGDGAETERPPTEPDHTIGDGGQNFTVSVGPLEDGFYVADTGTGIPDDVADSLFEAGVTTHDNGTGFGLRIVEKMAEAHGWTVTVTESETGGARFEFTEVDLYQPEASRSNGADD